MGDHMVDGANHQHQLVVCRGQPLATPLCMAGGKVVTGPVTEESLAGSPARGDGEGALAGTGSIPSTSRTKVRNSLPAIPYNQE